MLCRGHCKPTRSSMCVRTSAGGLPGVTTTAFAAGVVCHIGVASIHPVVASGSLEECTTGILRASPGMRPIPETQPSFCDHNVSSFKCRLQLAARTYPHSQSKVKFEEDEVGKVLNVSDVVSASRTGNNSGGCELYWGGLGACVPAQVYAY
jgi:hypothetical protein